MPIYYECPTTINVNDPSFTGGGDGRIRCSGAQFVEHSTLDTAFDPTTIDSETATAMFTAGFLLFLGPWAAAWGFKQLLKLLR